MSVKGWGRCCPRDGRLPVGSYCFRSERAIQSKVGANEANQNIRRAEDLRIGGKSHGMQRGKGEGLELVPDYM